ncbi:unnamed protein product [Discula destructiva]
MPIDEAKAIYEVNVWGTLSLVQVFSPLLLECKGAVMNISSIVGAANLPWQGAYNSSKAAVAMISESLRIDLEPLGVRVLTVMLGQVSDQIYDNTPDFHLRGESPYEKIAGTNASQSRGELNFNNEPAEVVARSLVRDTMSGRRGKI